MKTIFLLEVFFLCIVTSTFSFTHVDVSLQTNWHSPIIAQASEYIGDVAPFLYWDFFLFISDCISDNATDLDCFNCAQKFCTQRLPFGYSHLYGFVVGLQYYTPKIQMYQQLANEFATNLAFVNDSCNAFIVLCDEILVCDIRDLLAFLPVSSRSCISNTLNLGHKSDLSPYHVKNSSSSLIVLVYGPFGSKITTDILEMLYSLANRGFLGGFVYRPCHISAAYQHPTLLSGYGVELAIKSTEYHTVDDRKDTNIDVDNTFEHNSIAEIEGLNFELLSSLHLSLFEELHSLQDHLVAFQQDLIPLKKWQITDLGLQLCQWLKNSYPENGLSALNGLVNFIGYFPVECKHLYLIDVSDALRKEIAYNHRVLSNFGLENGQNIFFLNGKLFRNVEPFSLVPFLANELSLFSKLETLGVSPLDIFSLIHLDFDNEEFEFGIDTRHESIFYINDIEGDVEYSSWTTNLFELLRPTFPGVIRQVRRNFFDLVLCLDPSDVSTFHLVKTVEYFMTQIIPVKIGFIFLPTLSTGHGQQQFVKDFSCYFSFLSDNISRKYAFKWFLEVSSQMFSGNRSLSVQELSDHFNSYTKSRFIDSFSCSISINISLEFAFSRGLLQVPFVLLNGIPLTIPQESGNLRTIIKEAIFSQTRILQRDIYFSYLTDEMNVRDFIMTKSNIVSRLNYRILARNWKTLDFFCSTDGKYFWNTDFFALSSCEIARLFAKNTPYITHTSSDPKVSTLSLWLIADFSSANGFQLLLDSLKMLSTVNRVRICLIFNEFPSSKFTMNKLFLLLILSQAEENLFSYFSKLQNLTSIVNFTLEQSLQYFSKFDDFDETMFRYFALSDDFNIIARNHYHFASHILNISMESRAVVANGNILETISSRDTFNFGDFMLLESYFYTQFGEKVVSLFDTVQFNGSLAQHNLFRNTSCIIAFRSDIAVYLSTIFLNKQQVHRVQLPFHDFRNDYSLIHIPPRSKDLYYFRLEVILDPLSKEAQKLLPFSLTLYQTFNVHLSIWLCPLQRISDIPINRFYAFLLSSEPKFENNGSLSRIYPRAKFSHLPTTPLLNLILDVPHVWIVEPYKSEYDLDNLPRNSESNYILAVFYLSYVLLEGTCYHHSTNEPVPGLQFSLGTTRDPEQFDSLVMRNLGYFQLKFFPGLWKLDILKTESIQPYYISESSGDHAILIDETIFVYCDSFLGVNIQIFVTRHSSLVNIITDRNDYYVKDVSNGYHSSLNSIWQSVYSLIPHSQEYFVQNHGIVPKHSINIFSIASGHLYERFLRIMILSVLKHTNSPVKLWLLKQYLSPTFKDSFPKFARRYNFTFEYVEYKWPQWLQRQEEKQREIWGFKILFLDVLFPMHLDRILYIDADQIVRADLLELVLLDLEGAPYAYTPFCDSKKEMDGFRFWKHGYWKNLLGNRKYHISALSVIDLYRFRQLGAGDKLRANYQALSQDPNSLANLDQDLPNSMIDSVPIFSLPQEWLWCETWCSDEDKSKAKTIDMCNNPLTKEPKLTAAKRISSEWIDYDEEAEDIMLKTKSELDSNENRYEHTKHTEF